MILDAHKSPKIIMTLERSNSSEPRQALWLCQWMCLARFTFAPRAMKRHHIRSIMINKSTISIKKMLTSHTVIEWAVSTLRISNRRFRARSVGNLSRITDPRDWVDHLWSIMQPYAWVLQMEGGLGSTNRSKRWYRMAAAWQQGMKLCPVIYILCIGRRTRRRQSRSLSTRLLSTWIWSSRTFDKEPYFVASRLHTKCSGWCLPICLK